MWLSHEHCWQENRPKYLLTCRVSDCFDSSTWFCQSSHMLIFWRMRKFNANSEVYTHVVYGLKGHGQPPTVGWKITLLSLISVFYELDTQLGPFLPICLTAPCVHHHGLGQDHHPRQRAYGGVWWPWFSVGSGRLHLCITGQFQSINGWIKSFLIRYLKVHEDDKDFQSHSLF